MTRRNLIRFVTGRIAALAALVALFSILVFSLLWAAPGSPETILLGTRPSTPQTRAQIREEWHLNDPFFTQYARWASHAVRFDFGRSIFTAQPVTSVIGARLGLTLELGGLGFLLTMIIGVPIGVLAAVKARSVADRGAVSLIVIGGSAPPYVSGLLLLYIFAVKFALFPVFGTGSGVGGRADHLALPGIALALTGLGLVVKQTRTALIRALDTDYVTFARARGLSQRRILVWYGLRNSLVPIITAGGLLLGVMLAGTVLIETTFALPGLGSLLVDSVTNKDLPVVQALAVLIVAMIVLANLLADIAVALIDPRISARGRAT